MVPHSVVNNIFQLVLLLIISQPDRIITFLSTGLIVLIYLPSYSQDLYGGVAIPKAVGVLGHLPLLLHGGVPLFEGMGSGGVQGNGLLAVVPLNPHNQ